MEVIDVRLLFKVDFVLVHRSNSFDSLDSLFNIYLQGRAFIVPVVQGGLITQFGANLTVLCFREQIQTG
jgi:hypothetical protein